MGSFSIWHWAVIAIFVLIVVVSLRRRSSYSPDRGSPFDAAPQTVWASDEDGEGGFAKGARLPLILCALMVGVLAYAAQDQFGGPVDVFLVPILRSAAILALAAAGQALVVTTGRVDLSIGGTVGLSAAVMAYVSTATADAGVLPVAAGLATGAACGLANALLAVRVRAPAMLTTLVAGQVSAGLAWLLFSPSGVVLSGSDSDPLLFPSIQMNSFFDLSIGAVLSLIVVLGLGLLLARSGLGRNLQDATENWRNDGGRPIGVFVVSGILCALAAWLLVSEQRAVFPSEGYKYTLESLAVVIIGGYSLTGRLGSMAAVLLASIVVSAMTAFPLFFYIEARVQPLVGPLILLAGLLFLMRREKDPTE